jgi:hypothetical protein
MPGFCNSAGGLRAPDFADYPAKMPKVSGHCREYSRFSEDPCRRQGSIATARRMWQSDQAFKDRF